MWHKSKKPEDTKLQAHVAHDKLRKSSHPRKRESLLGSEDPATKNGSASQPVLRGRKDVVKLFALPRQYTFLAKGNSLSDKIMAKQTNSMQPGW